LSDRVAPALPRRTAAHSLPRLEDGQDSFSGAVQERRLAYSEGELRPVVSVAEIAMRAWIIAAVAIAAFSSLPASADQSYAVVHAQPYFSFGFGYPYYPYWGPYRPYYYPWGPSFGFG